MSTAAKFFFNLKVTYKNEPLGRLQVWGKGNQYASEKNKGF